MRFILILLLALSIAGCAADTKNTRSDTLATPQSGTNGANTETNPYAKAFVSRAVPKAALQPDPQGPKVYRGVEEIQDYQRMLENGFDMLGYSSFADGDVPPELLIEHAKKVKADLVLVYTKLAGNTPPSVKIQQLRSQAEEAKKEEAAGNAPKGILLPPEQIRYDYFASYWVKLAPPVIGVHVTSSQEETKTQGLKVIAVIKNSPAAQAGILGGDVITRIGEIELTKPEELIQASQRYAGQTVEVAWLHEGSLSSKPLTLNARK